MTYPHPSELSTGYVLLCHSPFRWHCLRSYGSWCIRQVSGYWNHSVVVVQDREGTKVLEAYIGKKLKIMPYQEWCDQTEREIKIIPVTAPAYRITALSGRPYDMTSALKWLIIQKFTGKWYGRTSERAEDKIYCFEAAALVHGLPEPWRALPEDLLQITI
jgi:hypothetical protein